MPRFTQLLLKWHASIDRELPWKQDKDPYKIWLSEIILQQTRVAQGTPYYLAFIEAYPTINDLAKANLDQVLRLWQGLGYYSRARNLHATAQRITSEFNGQFPKTYNEIIDLKGIGPYTAAAISSFAYDLPYPVVDGNVKRVLSRYFGITNAIDDSGTLKEINGLANQLIDQQNPAAYNQAIMDLGALVCLPKSAKCMSCPMNADCIAYKEELTNAIPYKAQKIKRTNRYFHYFVLEDENQNILINQRKDKDIWMGLYEFPMYEHSSTKELKQEEIQEIGLYSFGEIQINQTEVLKKHVLSHQNIYIRIYQGTIMNGKAINSSPFLLVKKDDLKSYAFPVVLANIMNRLPNALS